MWCASVRVRRSNVPIPSPPSVRHRRSEKRRIFFIVILLIRIFLPFINTFFRRFSPTAVVDDDLYGAREICRFIIVIRTQSQFALDSSLAHRTLTADIYLWIFSPFRVSVHSALRAALDLYTFSFFFFVRSFFLELRDNWYLCSRYQPRIKLIARETKKSDRTHD